MEKTSFNKQFQLEPNIYYSQALSFNFDFDEAFFKEGSHIGQFAAVKKNNLGGYTAVRDPLGIAKLFYTETPEGELHFSQRFADLFPYKSPVFSVPAGTMVSISSGGKRELVRHIGIPKQVDKDLSKTAFESGDTPSVINFKRRFENRLKKLFQLFGELEMQGWTFFVALSGGLDSTIIASKAAEYLKKPIACTLDLGKSEDSDKSQKIAKHIGIEQLVFPTNEESILYALKKAPALCQDFRDFNVHCAALNLLLAINIKDHVKAQDNIDNDKVIVLTGDLMNEFTCDYEGEVIDGVEYYKLPRIGKKELQDHLIKGLDTSDREISVFNAYGLHCIQPFAVLYDLYASVHESVFEADDPKKLLNTFQVDAGILKFIPKAKLRAQVGSRENMGILGLSHKKGYNNKTFQEWLLAESGFNDATIPIFVGRYDMENFK